MLYTQPKDIFTADHWEEECVGHFNIPEAEGEEGEGEREREKGEKGEKGERERRERGRERREGSGGREGGGRGINSLLISQNNIFGFNTIYILSTM
jgi:hypothetical protein